MTATIEEIKERLDIVQVLSEYIKLKKVGANWRTVCPFHSEKTPSFYVSPSRQVWHCFGCGKGGDIFKFLMEIEGIEFRDAMFLLAKKAGVEVKKEPILQRTERQRNFEICELAARFFEKQLDETKVGKKAKEYLLSRKISEDSLRKWRLGYAPNTWRGLSDFLVARGYKRQEIVKAGLASQSEEKKKTTSYDRFRGRIMFPIFNLQGQVVGFGGRKTSDIKTIKEKADKGEAKYMNTPNTLIYDKSRILYGLNNAKVDVRKKDDCILVEGYTDVILSSQEGVQNIVSTSGTTLTPYQLKILSRYTKNLNLGFDMDIAGEAATKKGIDIAQLQGFNIKIISMPQDKDPADVVNESPEDWRKIIEKADDIVNFYFQQSLKKFNKKDLKSKKEIAKIILPFISRIQNKIEQSHWTEKLAKELGVKEEAIWEELKRVQGSQRLIDKAVEELDKGQKEEPKSWRRLMEERLLMLFLKYPDVLKSITEEPDFSFKECKDLYQSLKNGKTPPEELKELVSILELQFEVEKERGGIEPKEECQFCKDSLKEFIKREKIKKIVEELKTTEQKGDKDKTLKLLKKLIEYEKS